MTSNRSARRQSPDRRLDETVADSFPASDPPSNSVVTGPGQPGEQPAEQRPPSHRRGDPARPIGHPTSDRHATETAHQWEDEEYPGQKHPPN